MVSQSIRIFVVILLITEFLILSGCTRTAQYAATGALAGSAAGAVIGNRHSASHRDKGALAGAALGALAGTAAANETGAYPGSQTGQLLVLCPGCGVHVDVTGFPDHSTVACPNCQCHFTY